MENNNNQSVYNQEVKSIKKEKYEQKHLEQEKLLESYNRKIKIRKILRIGIPSAVILIGVVVFVFWIFSGTSEKPGEEVSIQPADHIKPGEPITGIYLTNPPVSGWHYDETASLGIHDEEIKDQILISNLEQGNIWISYYPDAPPEVVEALKSIVEKYKDDVILTPRSNNDSLVSLAVWGRLDKFNYLDEARIVKFIKAYR
jgi:hypothetical protein